jgi:MFS family permease
LDFVLATLTNFVNSFSLQMLVATLPVYVISLGGSHADAGLVSGALALTAMLFRPLLGRLTDAWGRRPLILMGTSFYGVASVVYLLAGSIPLLVLGRLVQGFGLSCYGTASNAYVADISPLKRRAEAVGLFSAAQAVGYIIGPVIGFMLAGSTGFRHLFYFSGGLAIMAFAISIFTQERRQPWKIKRQPWSLRTSIVAVDALPFAWMALCMSIGFGAINAFIAIFAQSRGVQNPGFYFMVQAIALLVSRMFVGRLADRVSRAAVIIPGVILMAVALAMLPLTNGFQAFAISASLYGIGFGAAQPSSMALLFDRIRPEQRGLATSTYFMGFDVGVVIGTLLLGVVSLHWGFGVMWSISAACALLALVGILMDRHSR